MMHYLFGGELDLHYEALHYLSGGVTMDHFLRGLDIYFDIVFK